MGEELTEFPIICNRCIGENPYVKMVCIRILFLFPFHSSLKCMT